MVIMQHVRAASRGPGTAAGTQASGLGLGAASGGAERGRICSFRVPGQPEHREILGRSVVSVLQGGTEHPAPQRHPKQGSKQGRLLASLKNTHKKKSKNVHKIILTTSQGILFVVQALSLRSERVLGRVRAASPRRRLRCPFSWQAAFK